jgi:hypothetical protein
VAGVGLRWGLAGRAAFAVPAFDERVPLAQWGARLGPPQQGARAPPRSPQIEDWRTLPEPGPAWPQGLADLARRAANARWVVDAFPEPSNKDPPEGSSSSPASPASNDPRGVNPAAAAVRHLVAFWTGTAAAAGRAERHSTAPEVNAKAKAEGSAAESGSFEWSASPAAVALGKLRHRSTTVAGLKIHFIHELANIPAATTQEVSPLTRNVNNMQRASSLLFFFCSTFF